MNILIVGDLKSMAVPLARKFNAERHKTVLAGLEQDTSALDLHSLKIHAIDPVDPMFQEVMNGYRFDAVVFLGSREERKLTESGMGAGRMIDGLFNALSLSNNASVKRFLFVSSTEVFGAAINPTEETEPQPSSLNGMVLQSAEQYCIHYHQQFGLPVTILRVPYVYGLQATHGLLGQILQEYQGSTPVRIPFEQDAQLAFLHSDDVADFILAEIEEGSSSKLTVANLPAPDPLTARALVELLVRDFPDTKVQFTPDVPRLTHQAQGSYAQSNLDWTARRTLTAELPALLESVTQKAPAHDSWFTRFNRFWLGNERVTRWLELIIGAALVQWLTTLSGTLLQFRFIDFRLLFVVMMGSMHGTLFGLLAAIIASASAVFAWYQTGLDWNLLFYNIENWIPFALYFLAGGITGYLHDRHENEIRFQNQQVSLMHGKYQFLYGVYNEIRAIKDQFQDQLMGYRDSFGRIYTVTRDLDTLQEADVIFKALSILEDVMQNDQIAIYTVDKNRFFARLQANSRSLNGMLSTSLRLDDYPELRGALEGNTIFHNTGLLANHPAYFAPIFNQGVAVAAVAIWNVRFEQHSLAYLNLFRVLCGLIQSSLVRATLFSDINLANMYLPDTRILRPEAFEQVLQVKTRMRENQIANFRLLAAYANGQSPQDFFQAISSGIRAVDYIGEDNGDRYLILLSQTDAENARRVIDRLEKKGIHSELIQEDA